MGIRILAKDESAVSPVIGVILMVAITVVLAATVFVLVQNLTTADAVTPSAHFVVDGDTLFVQSADSGIPWGDLAVSGCSNANSGNVTAGHVLTDCAGRVTVTHTPTNQLIYLHQF